MIKTTFIMAFLVLSTLLPLHSKETKTSCYKITGMHCGNCADTIKKKVLENPNITSIDISIRQEEGVVTFDPDKTNDANIISDIKAAGYEGIETKCKN